MLGRGKVQQDGTPEQVQSHPNSPFSLYFTDVDVNRLPSTCQVRWLPLALNQPAHFVTAAGVALPVPAQEQPFNARTYICSDSN